MGAASWNNWALDEMAPESSAPGTFHLDVAPPSGGGDFQIIRNHDWTQVFFPRTQRASSAQDVDPTCPNEEGAGLYWFIDGRAGDQFRITLRRSTATATANNIPTKKSGVLRDK